MLLVVRYEIRVGNFSIKFTQMFTTTQNEFLLCKRNIYVQLICKETSKRNFIVDIHAILYYLHIKKTLNTDYDYEKQ